MSATADAHSVSEMNARVEAERAGRPFLLYRDGHERQQLFVFPSEATQASVGRRAPAELLLDWDEQVSRLHARFERVGDDWELIDDGLSRNGTFLNEERLSGRRGLKDGDILRFGATTVTFRSPHSAQPASASSGAAAGAAQTPAAVGLSSTQRRVLLALCRPYKAQDRFASPATDQEIADELVLSAGEVRTHLSVLYAKLGVEQLPAGEMRMRLVERAFSAGLISQGDL